MRFMDSMRSVGKRARAAAERLAGRVGPGSGASRDQPTAPTADKNATSPTAVDSCPHVALNITKRCNQRCVFCFEGDRETWSEPTLADVERLLRESAATHGLVIFMGGEALLRRDILDVVRYAKSRGVALHAFTNGQVLARPGFVADLAEAGLDGLEISFHVADAESFGRYSGLKPSRYERLLRGLEVLRDHNTAHRDRAVKVTIETDLFHYNRGRLAAIRDLLVTRLGDSYRLHRIGAVQPQPSRDPGTPLLEPLAERREELVRFLETHPADRRVMFSKVPLCLVPGWEHRSMDLPYKLLDIDVRSNFHDKDRLGQMIAFHDLYRANPYRWVCAGCNLLPLCPTTRTSWRASHESYAPARAQKPIPETVRTAEDVLARIERLDDGAHAALRLMREHLATLAIPEGELLDAIREACDDEVAFVDAWCEATPLLAVELSVRGVAVIARFRPLRPHEPDDASVGASDGETDGPTDGPTDGARFVLGYLSVTLSAATRDAVATALARLRGVSLPPLQRWCDVPGVDTPLGAAALATWGAFGDALWPGVGRLGRWRTEETTATARGLVLRVAHDDGRGAHVYAQAGPLRDLPPPALGAVLAAETPALRVFVRARAEAEPAPPDLLGAVTAALTARAGAAAANAPEGERPPQPRAPDAARPSSSLEDRAGTLRVAFSDREGRRGDVVFHVGELWEGEPAFRRVGRVGILHAPSDDARVLEAAARLLAHVAASAPAPPRPGNAARWAGAIHEAVAASPLGRRFDCRVEPVGPRERA